MIVISLGLLGDLEDEAGGAASGTPHFHDGGGAGYLLQVQLCGAAGASPHWSKAVIGTIPSIPIPILFANFGIELTHNSNSSLGICATTPTPIQWNWGDSKGFQCLF